MKLDLIEDMIYKEKINLLNTYLENTSGAYIHYEKINAILYDNSKLNNNISKKQVFMEELGHYYTNATYTFYSDSNYINKQEYKAKKWAYNALIPYEALKSAIKKRN